MEGDRKKEDRRGKVYGRGKEDGSRKTEEGR